jgi:hypothetical protein
MAGRIKEASSQRDPVSQSKKKRKLPVSQWEMGPMTKKSELQIRMIHDMISFIVGSSFPR